MHRDSIKSPPPEGKIKIAICGACGSGKSTLGGKIRKKGFGDFKPYQIAVIDDNVMSLNLFIARPKLKIPPPPQKMDNCKPFLKFLPFYVKLVFCIGASTNRLDFADILILTQVSQEARLKRLTQREKDPQRIQSLLNASITPNLRYNHKMLISLEESFEPKLLE